MAGDSEVNVEEANVEEADGEEADGEEANGEEANVDANPGDPGNAGDCGADRTTAARIRPGDRRAVTGSDARAAPEEADVSDLPSAGAAEAAPAPARAIAPAAPRPAPNASTRPPITVAAAVSSRSSSRAA